MPLYTEEELKRVSNTFGEISSLKKLEDLNSLADAVESFDPVLKKYLNEFAEIMKNMDEEVAHKLGRKMRKTYFRKNSR